MEGFGLAERLEKARPNVSIEQPNRTEQSLEVI
jgi:hypothetical protein